MAASAFIPRRLSIILPCYNESQAVPSVLGSLLQLRPQLCDELGLESCEILVVDDGSRDKSQAELKRLQQENAEPFEILTHLQNQGYGRALKTGMQQASGEYLAFYDLDGTCSATDLLKLVPPVIEGADLVTGVRLSPDSQMPTLRRLGNELYRQWARVLTGKELLDWCSGYRVLHRRRVAQAIQELPDNLDFTLAMTVLATRQNWQQLELPVQYAQRLGESKLHAIKDGLRFFATLTRFALQG